MCSPAATVAVNGTERWVRGALTDTVCRPGSTSTATTPRNPILPHSRSSMTIVHRYNGLSPPAVRRRSEIIPVPTVMNDTVVAEARRLDVISPTVWPSGRNFGPSSVRQGFRPGRSPSAMLIRFWRTSRSAGPGVEEKRGGEDGRAHVEGVATHGCPELFVVCRDGCEALTRVCAGGVIEPRDVHSGVVVCHAIQHQFATLFATRNDGSRSIPSPTVPDSVVGRCQRSWQLTFPGSHDAWLTAGEPHPAVHTRGR